VEACSRLAWRHRGTSRGPAAARAGSDRSRRHRYSLHDGAGFSEASGECLAASTSARPAASALRRTGRLVRGHHTDGRLMNRPHRSRRSHSAHKNDYHPRGAESGRRLRYVDRTLDGDAAMAMTVSPLVSSPVVVPGRRMVAILSLAAAVGAVLSSGQLWLDLQIVGRPDLLRATIGPMASPWVLLALSSPVVVWSSRRWPLAGPVTSGAWWRHVLLAATVTVMQSVILAAVIAVVTPEGRLSLRGITILTGVRFSLSAFGYGAMVAAVTASDAQRLARAHAQASSALSLQLAGAQLDALRAQLRPHFLFNAMNTVSMLIRRDDRSEAVEAMAALGGLLRHVLDDARRDVPLHVEIDFIRQYLQLEQLRFGDRLSVRFDVAPPAYNVLVPSLILQPLVENAVRHGVGRRSAPGRIRVVARIDGLTLTLEVTDDGPGLEGREANPDGVGLRNTRARLATLFGDSGALDIRGSRDGTVARLRLPVRSGPTPFGPGVAS
jgi:two-component system LytT family sensor kinase